MTVFIAVRAPMPLHSESGLQPFDLPSDPGHLFPHEPSGWGEWAALLSEPPPGRRLSSSASSSLPVACLTPRHPPPSSHSSGSLCLIAGSPPAHRPRAARFPGSPRPQLRLSPSSPWPAYCLIRGPGAWAGSVLRAGARACRQPTRLSATLRNLRDKGPAPDTEAALPAVRGRRALK